jgi:integrase
MPRLVHKPPAYSLHKPSGQAKVKDQGRTIYLGKYGSPESWEKYHRFLAERCGRVDAGARQQIPTEAEPLTITELTVRYVRHAEQYYVKNGKVTNQVTMIKLAIKVLRRLYGSTFIKDFGPVNLKACRAKFVREGLSRGECNRRTNLIKQCFRWAAENELAPRGLYHDLCAVQGLRKGRSEARETRPVGPVPDAIVERTLEHLSPTVASMVRIQLATGMRPGELVIMRARDLNMSGPIWEYRPDSHKGEHHDALPPKVIMIGPRAQALITPLLSLDISGYLFSPRRVVARVIEDRRAARKSPLWASHVEHQAKKRAARGRRSLKDRYDVNAYRRAIARACDRAFPHPVIAELADKNLDPARHEELKAWCAANQAALKEWEKSHGWHPHQLRHSAATLIRRRFGVEAAQAVLGHSQIDKSELYAEKSLDAARTVAREIG